MKKVLLLNLPSKRKIQRDYGCPHGVKADYYWPPVDLLVFSAILDGAANLEYLDCIAGGVDRKKALEAIAEMKPDHIFTILSSITLAEDLAAIRDIKSALPRVEIWASGDVVFFESGTLDGIDHRVRNLSDRESVLALLNGRCRKKSPAARFRIGLCRHDLLEKYRYTMPYSLYPRITTVLTNYGCPFRCSFCNSKNLGFKARDLSEVVEELKRVEALGIKEVYFRDFTFGVPDAEALCDAMLKNNIRLRWSCETRVDMVNERLLRKMKSAGCYLIFYGIESGDQAALDAMKKGFSLSKAKESIALTKRAGLEVLTSFIFGLPGEDLKKTRELISELDPDYLSINLLVPRLGSDIRKSEKESSHLANTDPLLSTEPALTWERDSVEKRFYLRPSKIVSYLVLSLKSPYRLVLFMRNLIALLKKWFIH